ncbi:MAG: protein kinase family protein [Bacillus sp. (in: firmicutes)]
MKILSDLRPGTILRGKWNGETYRTIKKLGMGANGVVYLVEHHGKPYAMKLSDNMSSLTSEMNVLKSFSKVQGASLGPSFLHGDDWVSGNDIYPFYIMEYIRGEELLSFTEKNGKEQIVIMIIQLLSSLGRLHDHGWIFGDLKPENLLVTDAGYQVRCIDVGGTTQEGRSVKEFTEFFDRGYWGLGSRKAEPAYDLFAVAMIIINIHHPGRFNRRQDGYAQLNAIIDATKGLQPFKQVLCNALLGKYRTAYEMKQDMLHVIQTKKSKQKPVYNSSRSTTAARRRTKQKDKARPIEFILLLFLVSCLYGLYIYNQLGG